MLRIPFFLASFMLILSNLVIAEAAVPGLQTMRFDFATWTSTHTGQATVNGQTFTALLEQSKQEVAVPEIETGKIQSLVPMASIEKKIHRLVLIDKKTPSARLEIYLDFTTIDMDGQVKKALVSKDGNNSFRFIITNNADGTLLAQYVEKNGKIDKVGEFNLQPMFSTL